MRYLFLLYGDEAAEEAMSADERRRVMDEHLAFSERMQDSGRYVIGVGLEASSTATVVRRTPGGEDLVTDGPFAESKEQMGGLYLLDCADLDEALRIAGQIPVGPGVAIELRPAPV
jgi:hypothetical protein